MMGSIAKLLKRRPWAIFLAHQSLIFVTAVIFLNSVRRITGRNIHLGRDPVGFIDGVALVALSAGVIFMTRALYRWVKGANAPPLGIAPSPRRLLDLLAGLLIGFAIIVWPYLNALLTGTAAIGDRITEHFDNLTALRVLTVAFFLLLLQGMTEETANRAFPMRLWEHRSHLFRILIPSIFFAAIHLADEEFSLERLGLLLMGGVTQSLAYTLTGNIWLSSGVHTGANLASFSISGLWHAGAVIALVGRVAIPNWLAVILMLVLFCIAVILHGRRKRESPPSSIRAV
jgi:hypothetical protein